MPDDALIDIKNATVYRGDTKVFDGLSLSIAQGEQVAILGPNGSGKTTLLKVINRELYPVVAEDSWIRILGREKWNVWELRKHIGIVSHELQMRYTRSTPGLAVVLSGFHSSVGVHGLLATKITAEARDLALAAMQRQGIAHLASRQLAEMSTGQQRRCLLARALVHDPDTLILDEPTAGLDLTASFALLESIRALSDAGKSLVFVTHELNEIPPAVRRVILLRDGQVVADDEKEAVLTTETLARAYDTRMRVSLIDGYFVATPTH